MNDAGTSRTLRRVVIGIVAGVASLLIAGVTIVLTPQPTMAKPEFAAQTKKPCGFCHQNPGGGGPLTGAGAKFKANGFKL